MESSEFRDQIKELVSLTDFPIVPDDMCWFDGSRCPYGFPGGKFQLRPTQFCHLHAHGCHKLLAASFEDDFGVNEEAEWELRPGDIKEILENEVPKLIDKNCLRLSKLVQDISSDDTENFPPIERKVLELAANILVDSSSDCKLITEDFDFEDFDL